MVWNFLFSFISAKIFLIEISKLLQKKLIDELHVFKAPFNIGSSGKPMILGKKIHELSLKEIAKKSFGKDVYHYFLFIN